MSGLRERKKAKTKIAIQQHAIRLFREQGYAATTVEQIAEAAEVSPSTVFRYFATKDDLVTTDEVDPVIFAAFEDQPPELGLAGAWRAAMRVAFERMTDADMASERERMLLILTVPELWAASQGNVVTTLDTMVELSARRLGRAADDVAVRNAVGAMFGALLLMVLDWARRPDADLRVVLDRAFEEFAAGLALL
ncbi:MAG: TetR family transcriptional regulator [Actinophytocola sp.]|uniref:acyl-CoA-like ligand-binding transcription factor n=1 Tax=Actinophytocola sp. TaxID=1872138 RepID=UPI003D6AA23A